MTDQEHAGRKTPAEHLAVYRQDPECLRFVWQFFPDPADQEAMFATLVASFKDNPSQPEASDDEWNARFYRGVLDQGFALLAARNEQYIASFQSRYGLTFVQAEDLCAETFARLYRHLCTHHYNILSSLKSLIHKTAHYLYLDDIGYKKKGDEQQQQASPQKPRNSFFKQQHQYLEERHIDELERTLLTNPDEESFLATNKVEELLSRITGVKGGDERKQWLLRLSLLEDRTPREIAALDKVARELVAERSISAAEAKKLVMDPQELEIQQRIVYLEADIKDGTIRMILKRACFLLLLVYTASELHEELERLPDARRRMYSLIDTLSTSRWKTPEEVYMVRMFVQQGRGLEEIVTNMSTISPRSLSKDECRKKLQKCLRQLFQAFAKGREE